MATSTVQGEKRPEASTGGEGGERSSPSWQGGNDIALHGLQSASQPAIQLVANISLPGKQRADCCQFADWKTKAQQDLVSAQRHLGSELSLKPVTLAQGSLQDALYLWVAEKVLPSPSLRPTKGPPGCLSSPPPPLSPPWTVWDRFCCHGAGNTSGFSFPALVIEAATQMSTRRPGGLRGNRRRREETRQQARPVPTGSPCPRSLGHRSSAWADFSHHLRNLAFCAHLSLEAP